MRPKSMRLFDSLFLAGIALGLLNVILGLTVFHDGSDMTRTTDGMPMMGSVAFATVITLTLWYLVSRLRMSALRWVLLVLVVVGLATLAPVLLRGLDARLAIGLVASLLQAVGISYLFRPDARAWFAASET